MKITLESLSVTHPAAAPGARPALGPLTLAVEPGEQLAVIGPSGAGKTTLLHTLGCALVPAAGRLAIDGRDPWRLRAAELRALRSTLFIAPQVPPLPPRQRVVTAVLAGRLPQMGLWQSLRSLVHPVDSALAQQALERFDLADKLFLRVDRLSGGERQRVGLARAVVAHARLLLVDEPLSALDPARATQAVQSLCGAAREDKATLVCTLHDVPMALRHFPRIVGLRDGALAFDLPAAQVSDAVLRALYAQHEHELAASAAPAALPAVDVPLQPVAHCR